MPPEAQSFLPDFFQILLYIAGFFAVLWIKDANKRVAAAEQACTEVTVELERFRAEVAQQYVSKNDVREQNLDMIDRLKDIQAHITRLEEKLDNKQDKKNG